MKNNEVLMTKKELKAKAKEIIKLAEESGTQSNYIFVTTFERYQQQLDILEKLKEKIKEDGMVVEKTYVKGRENVYTNPAVTEYNRTTDSANKTVATLLKIIKSFGSASDQDDIDPLLGVINGE